MVERASAALPQGASGAASSGAWLSLPALFSSDRVEDFDGEVADGVRSQTDAEQHSHRSDCSGLSAIRMDLSDIQEAIKNHDLWVQDAAAMRSDIDELQAAIQKQEGWMTELSTALRDIRKKEDRLEGLLPVLMRRASTKAQPAAGGSAARPSSPGGSPGSGALHAESLQASHGFSTSSRSRLSSSKPGGLRPVASWHGCDADDGVVSATGANAPRGSAGSERLSTDSEDVDNTEMDRLEIGLTQQLSRGLRMLRNMVTAVEGGLARQLDGERAARRAAFAELRLEIAAVSASTAITAASIEDSNAGVTFAAGGGEGGHSAVSAAWSAQAREGIDGSMRGLRDAMAMLEQRAADRWSQAERSLAELRSELLALRTEQHLQAVATGALALTSGRLSPDARLRSIKALEDRAASVQRSDECTGTLGGVLSSASCLDAPTRSFSLGSQQSLMEEPLDEKRGMKSDQKW